MQAGIAPGYGLLVGIIGVGMSLAGAVDEYEERLPEET